MRLKSQRGQSMVEFCLVIPLFLILLVGMVEFSLVLLDQAMITSCSRECARAGIVSDSPRDVGTVTARINNAKASYANKLITFGDPNPTVTPDFGTVATGNALKITVTCDYNFQILPAFISGGSTLTLHAITVMNYE